MEGPLEKRGWRKWSEGHFKLVETRLTWTEKVYTQVVYT